MAQTPRGGLYGPLYKGHLGVCAIYSETTVEVSLTMFDRRLKTGVDHTNSTVQHGVQGGERQSFTWSLDLLGDILNSHGMIYT